MTLPGFSNKPKSSFVQKETFLLSFLPGVLTVGRLPFGAGSLPSVLRLLPPLGPALQVMKEKGKRSSEHIHQINVDISKTLRTHIFFRDRYGAK